MMEAKHDVDYVEGFEPSPQDQLDTQEDIQYQSEQFEHCNDCGSNGKKLVGKDCEFCVKTGISNLSKI